MGLELELDPAERINKFNGGCTKFHSTERYCSFRGVAFVHRPRYAFMHLLHSYGDADLLRTNLWTLIIPARS